MKDDFLSDVLGNAPRARLLRVFLFNPTERFTTAEVAKRSGIVPRNVEKELDVLEKWGVIQATRIVTPEAEVAEPKPKATKKNAGKNAAKNVEIVWGVDQSFTHLRALTGFVREVAPMQHDAVLSTLKRAGKLSAVILSGMFMGDETRPVDILVALDEYSEKRMESAIHALEPTYGHEIRYAIFSTPEFRYRLSVHDRLLRDTIDYPHLVLLDKAGIL